MARQVALDARISSGRALVAPILRRDGRPDMSFRSSRLVAPGAAGLDRAGRHLSGVARSDRREADRSRPCT